MAGPTVMTLGGYTLIECIGRGGMGEVWRAEHTGAGGVRRRAAVKRILPQFQNDPVLRERFIAEARITSRLEHPNIVQVLHFDDRPEPYLVLEYIDGLSVAELLRRGVAGTGKLTLASALYIVAEAADALDYAHRRTDDAHRPLGIVHRDVSPPNILVSLDGAVKVNDFGVARAVDNIVRTQAGLAVGKLVYMAPEQALGSVVDARADVFALGIVLWELLTLRPLLPRNGSAASMLENLQRLRVTPPSTLVPSIPHAVDDLVREALEHDPAARTASAGRLGKALRMVLHSVAPGFDRRDLANSVRDAAPDLAVRASSERGTSGGSARDLLILPVPGVSLLAAHASEPTTRTTSTSPSPSPPPPPSSAIEPLARADLAMDYRGPATRIDGSSIPAPPARPPDLADARVEPLATVETSVPVPSAPRAMLPALGTSACRTATPPPHAIPRRAIRLVAGVFVLLLLAAAGIFVWTTYGTDLLATSSPPVAAPAIDPVTEALRVTIRAALPFYVVTCTAITGTAAHGTLRADVMFQPSGELQGVRVLVNGGTTPGDQALAACVERYLWVIRAPGTVRGRSIENISATF